MELFSRTSINTARHSYALEALNPQPHDDTAWSWSSLRRQFREKNLEELYSEYQQKLHNGYFSVFILLQIITTALYLLILVFSENYADIFFDIGIYLISAVVLCLLGVLVFRESIAKRFPWIPLLVSALTMVLLVFKDIGLLIIHLNFGSKRRLRPAFTTYTILSCYIFLPLTNNKQSIILAFTATACEFICFGWIVYTRRDDQYLRLASETVYLLTLNGLGLYFHFLNEITLRRTFLDRRACVQSTYQLIYEKGQEDQLLLSVLPRHFVDVVRENIRKLIVHVSLHQVAPPERSPFSRMYVKQHNNVTILYADVVNFSKLTVSMTVKKLVETLNELFSKFDQASESKQTFWKLYCNCIVVGSPTPSLWTEPDLTLPLGRIILPPLILNVPGIRSSAVLILNHNVLRIKFLGDCYYCVSGVPEMDPNHAKNCVDLGLDMIAIIKNIREERRLKYHLDMRIGIHSGDIFSGLLGQSKWQYDIWSKDVVIANHMEQAGEPGKVHVTKQTLNFLGHEYSFRPAYGASRNKLLAKYNIETFFIITNNNDELESGSLTPDSIRSSSPIFEIGRPAFNRIRNSTTRRLTVSKSTLSRRSGEALVSARRNTLFMEHSVQQYHQTQNQADNQMAKTIHNMHVGLFDRWLRREQINPCCLSFDTLTWEISYIRQPDPLFKYYLFGALIVLLAVISIQALGIPKVSWHIWLVDGVCIILVSFLVILCWPWSQKLRVAATKGLCLYNLIHKLHRSALLVSWNVSLRTLIYIPTVCALIGCIFTLMLDTSLDNLVNIRSDTPWHISQTVTLAIIMSFFFFKVHFLLKFLTGCLIAVVYAYCIWEVRSELYQNGETWHPNIEPKLAHLVHVVLLTFSLHLIDRQAEFINRLDYRWKRQLSEEQLQVSNTREVNKMLLRNILPYHVAEHYLNMNRSVEDLYCEEYQCVAVMFASLIDYSEEIDSGIDKVSLTVLNEIICEFDKLLCETSGERVEKIKVAGLAYMAACGLATQVRENPNSIQPLPREHVAVVLTRFATRMMCALATYNQECNKFQQQSFQLRVGISHGPVNAGVIGAQKPLYDIWGDTVNIASRMDTTGLSGKIQITKHTARILKENNIECDFRGEISIKGQGIMPTFFVSLSEDFEPKMIITSLQQEVSSEKLSSDDLKEEMQSIEVSNKFNTKL